MKVTLDTLFQAHPAFEILGMQFFALDKIASARHLVDQVNGYYLTIAEKQRELLSFYGNQNEEGKWHPRRELHCAVSLDENAKSGWKVDCFACR